MATYRKTFTKPLPASAEIFTRKGERFARWKDGRGKTRTAPLTTGRDGSDRIVGEAATYTAKYREDMAQLNALPPTIEPHATHNIGAMIELTRRLMEPLPGKQIFVRYGAT